jgi:hypothetical protein
MKIISREKQKAVYKCKVSMRAAIRFASCAFVTSTNITVPTPIVKVRSKTHMGSTMF